MPIYSVRELTDNPDLLHPETALHVYNGLDCILTQEIFTEQQKLRDSVLDQTYRFSMAMLNPALAMMHRGIRIDGVKRAEKILSLTDRANKLQQRLNQLSGALIGEPLNANSPKQVADFFYDHLGLEPPYEAHKGQRKLRPTSKAALLHLQNYEPAGLFSRYILDIKSLRKQISVLNSGVSSDGRMRCSYQVCGTETGRWSSNRNCFGGGTNLQNITKDLRDIFIPDPGMVMCYADLERAEAVVVAYAADDENYIHATTGTDTHLATARMCWPELAWTGDDATDKAGVGAEIVTGTPFSFRDLAKRAAHGTNYYAKPRTISTHLKIPLEVANQFQSKYFDAYPKLRAWHHRTSSLLQREREITTPYFGRRRRFLSRPNDDATLREAIAYVPQSMVGDILNLGLYRVWKYLEVEQGLVEILGQVHDAILLQCRPCDIPAVQDGLKALMEFPIPFPSGREMTIRVDTNPKSFGDNWKLAS